MSLQGERWRQAAIRPGIMVVTPATVILAGRSIAFTALLPQFGGPNGMIVEPDWSAIEPNVDALLEAGFGYSCVELGDGWDEAGMRKMPGDWTWNGRGDKPDWA